MNRNRPAGRTADEMIPCRVNELFSAGIRRRLSLNGRWRFVVDPNRRLTPEQAATARPARTLQVPGCWEAQGVGGAGLLTRTSVNTDRFRGTYRGLGWYSKRFEYRPRVPDRRLWLKMGVVHGAAAMVLNGRRIGALTRTLGAYRFDITDACRPAGNLLVIAADNDLEPSGGANDALGVLGGLTQGVEIEQTASAWISALPVTGDVAGAAAVGYVEIRGAMNPGADYAVRLSVSRIGGGADRRLATLHVAPGTGGGAVRVPFRLPVTRPCLWAPDTSFLYRLTARLYQDGARLDEVTTRFGFRTLAVRGRKILLNGRPFFLAGCGTMTHTPDTVSPPTDRAALRRELRRLKAHGFVHIRYHTETPYDELLDAADETGVLIQPENRPYQGRRNEPIQAGGAFEFDARFATGSDAETQWHIRETALIHEHFGHHPSLAVYCMGNEFYSAKLATRARWRAAVKAMDPTRLVISSEGTDRYHPAADDYVAGFHNDAASLRAAPVVLHEFINVPTVPDPREAARFQGGQLVPDSLRRYRAWARRNRIGRARLVRLAKASHALQGAHLKYGIEKARAIPGIEGYGLWRYHDYWHFASSIGVVTVHGADKDRSAADLRAYNGQAVLFANLARDNMEITGMPMAHRPEIYGRRQVEGVGCCGQPVALTIFLALGGAPAVRGGAVTWRVVSGGHVLTAGRWSGMDARTGARVRCGTARWTMPNRGAPCEVRVEAALESPAVRTSNAWSLWAFPSVPPVRGSDLAACGAASDYFPLDPGVARVAGPAGLSGRPECLLITDSLTHEGVRDFVVRGGRVLLVSARDFPSQFIVSHPGWWIASPHRFTGAALETHPLFRDWPNAGCAEWPFLRFFMSKEAAEFPRRLDGRVLPTTTVPVFERIPFAHDALAYGVRSVQEHYTFPVPRFQFGWMPYLFELRIGAGRVFACMLRLRQDPLVGHWLARSLVTYLRSDKFRPRARAAWRRVCPPRPRDVAVNAAVYVRRAGGADQVFLHGARPRGGYRLAVVLTTHPSLQTVPLGRCCPPHFPKTGFLDLGVRWRIGQVLVRSVANGIVRQVRVSVGLDQRRWKRIGTHCFPRGRAAAHAFAGGGREARFVRLECLDAYEQDRGAQQRLALGRVTVRPA